MAALSGEARRGLRRVGQKGREWPAIVALEDIIADDTAATGDVGSGPAQAERRGLESRGRGLTLLAESRGWPRPATVTVAAAVPIPPDASSTVN